jgi:two-component system response regulator YesN
LNEERGERSVTLKVERIEDCSEWKEKWYSHLPYKRQLFFQHWITGAGGYSDRDIRDRGKQLLIPFDDREEYIVTVVDLEVQPDNEPLLSKFVFYNILGDMIHYENNHYYVFQDAKDATVIIFKSKPEEEEETFIGRVNATIAEASGKISHHLGWPVALGIGACVRKADEVVLSYQQASYALQERRGYGNQALRPIRDKSLDDVFAESDLVKALKTALGTGNSDKAEEIYQCILERTLLKASGVSEIKENILLLSSLFVRIIHLQGLTVREIVKEDYVYFNRLDSLLSKEQVVSLFHRTVRNIVAHNRKQRMSNTKQLVGDILDFVEKELMRGINLHMVADHFYFNSSYLSRIFKQETGKVFSAYLLERKMEKARQLLQEGMKVYDLAGLLGYADVSYFIRLFHKHWGVTPGELKR